MRTDLQILLLLLDTTSSTCRFHYKALRVVIATRVHVTSAQSPFLRIVSSHVRWNITPSPQYFFSNKAEGHASTTHER
jgi:hypothetical protein